MSGTGASGAGFRLDLGRCVGCGACVLACRIENRLPSQISWRRVLPVNAGRIGGGPTYHLSLACHHCESPACLQACPTGAYEIGDDGVVSLVTDRCIGCRYCEMACPFGAPAYDHDTGVMTKCTYCDHRVSAGLEPACVAACPTGALERAGDARLSPGRTFLPAWETPGFEDPAACRPSLSFASPRGRIRSLLFGELTRALDEALVHGSGKEGAQ